MSKALIENLPQLTVEDFRKLITQKALEHSKSIFKNGSPENANIVASNIFKNASTVRIYAENMDGKIGDCLPDYYSELVTFISKEDSKLTIVLDKFDQKKSKSLQYLLDYKDQNPNKIAVHKASNSFEKAIKEYKVDESNDLHFMTGDLNKFRLEYNKSSKSAYFSFNNQTITETLVNVFDANLNSCEKV